MLIDRRFPPTALVCAVSSVLLGGAAMAQAPAVTPDVQLMQAAEALSAQGEYSKSAAAYEDVVKKYPQMPSAPEANFRAGYAHYLASEFDPALASFKKVIDNKNLPPEMAQVLELSLSLTPQVLSAKATKMAPDDAKRTATFEDAVKQFDAYLAKYPNNDEAESASYGKALALYQLTKFDESIQVLRGNITKFAQSPTILDSQYLLALTLATVASNAKEKETKPDPTADAQYDESEKILRDLTKKPNLALKNDAQFQIGDLLLSRAGFLSEPEQKKQQQDLFSKAIEAYRAVISKDAVLAAQKQRIAQYIDARNKAGAAKDLVNFQKLKRLADKETEKLAQIEGRADQTVSAKVKTGLIYFSEGKMDETRVLFSQLDAIGAIEDPADKKQALYLETMSYAVQKVVDKAVAKYQEFQSQYKGDPIGQNLQLVMGAMYLDPESKAKNPDEAIKYFNEGIETYPKGKNLGTLILARAGAQIDLGKFDDATDALKKTLANKPPKDLAVDAEFYLGTVYIKTNKEKEAVATFKEVRDKYPGTPQAEQSAFQVGQLLSTLDPKASLPELQSFLSKYPKSELVPTALLALGSAQARVNESADALATFKKLETEYPKSAPAPFSYFERGKILAGQQKYDETIAAMKEFTKEYPDSPMLYQAYDFSAQILASQSKSVDSIAAYEEYVAKRPKDKETPEALLKLSGLWKAYAESQGPYLVLDEPKRVEWKKGIDKSTAAVEQLLTDFPESEQVAQGLKNLLDVQRLLQNVKLKSEDDVDKYFQDFAKKFSDKPGTQAKVLFTLATFTFDKDKAKAVEQMTQAYKPDLKFAPDDLDLYGQALIDSKKIDEAIAIYQKLADDYKYTGDPKNTPREVKEAQAIVLAGMGKAYQEKGDAASKEKAAKMFAELEKDYSWSPKMLEVNYGLALALHDKTQDDDAMKRLFEVIKAPKATAELRAKSMLLLGKIHEANQRYENAIDNYLKISVYYAGVPKVAAEGLWLGAQLLERQSTGDIPMPTPKPGATPAKK